MNIFTCLFNWSIISPNMFLDLWLLIGPSIELSHGSIVYLLNILCVALVQMALQIDNEKLLINHSNPRHFESQSK